MSRRRESTYSITVVVMMFTLSGISREWSLRQPPRNEKYCLAKGLS
jgi:hypothetical protein